MVGVADGGVKVAGGEVAAGAEVKVGGTTITTATEAMQEVGGVEVRSYMCSEFIKAEIFFPYIL